MDPYDPHRPFQGFEGFRSSTVLLLELAMFPVTLILLVISTTMLENSLALQVETVCTKPDISAHYVRSIWTLVVGTILVVQVILEIAIPAIILISTLLNDYITKFSQSNSNRWKTFCVDLIVDLIACSFLALLLIPWIMLTKAWAGALRSEFHAINLSSMVNRETPESASCCGTSTYTQNLTGHSTLNFASEIYHCRLPTISDGISPKPPICCCFEPKRVISYLNLATYNIIFFAIRSFVLITIVASKVGAKCGKAVEERTWNQHENGQSRSQSQIPIELAYIRRSPSPKGKRNTSFELKKLTKSTIKTKTNRDDKIDQNNNFPSRYGELSHLAYTFHSSTVEYWMDLIFRGVTADGLQNVHMIGVLNYQDESGSTPTRFGVIKDVHGGYVMIVKSDDKVKGLALANGNKIALPIISDDCIQIRTARMFKPSDFEERIFSKDEEVQRSLHLGGILIECRLDAYLGSVQILDNSGAIVKLGIRNYSKKDTILTEDIDGGFIQIVMNKNNECRGIALVYCPNKEVTKIPTPPKSGSNSNSSKADRDQVNYFVSISIQEK